jgi:hypothetical protein
MQVQQERRRAAAAELRPIDAIAPMRRAGWRWMEAPVSAGEAAPA